MIKCNVTVRGAISRQAAVRTNKEGKEFVSFAMNVVLPAKKGINKTVEILVTKDGTVADAVGLSNGVRIEVQGTMMIRKRGEEFVFTLHADNLECVGNTNDSIEGTMEFRGTVGKQIEVKTDRNGHKYTMFSAFTTDKNGDDFEFLWVRFLRFAEDELEYLRLKAKVKVTGTLDISAYNDHISLSCKVDEISEYVPQNRQ